jgi:hypothetical protein
MESYWNDDQRGGNPKKLGEKPVLVPLPPSRISHETTWDRLAFIRNNWYSTVEPVEIKKVLN